VKNLGSLIVLGIIVSIVVSACVTTSKLGVEPSVQAAITATQTTQPTATPEPKSTATSTPHTPTFTPLAQDSDTLLLSTATPTSSDTTLEISAIVPASDGGELTLPNKAVLRIPPNSLQEDTQVTIRRVTVDDVPSAQQELAFVGDVYDIDLGTNQCH
jgi:hypothetical protein